jgi:hypothetical protein
MYWRQNRLKPLTTSAKKREERRLKQTKRYNLFLFAVVMIGFILIFINLTGQTNESTVPIDFSNENKTVREWKQSGFVKSMDDATGTLVLNETLWNDLSAPQRESVVILLRVYYAHLSDTKESNLIIKGDLSQQLLVRSEVVSISGK